MVAQGCLEMEKDLIDDDRRKVAAKPPPSLTELNEFRRALEKTLEDEVRGVCRAINDQCDLDLVCDWIYYGIRTLRRAWRAFSARHRPSRPRRRPVIQCEL